MSMAKTRLDGRNANQLRETHFQLRPQRYPEGSILWRSGQTTILISASVEEGVRDFLKGSGKGWVTAEYAMHPRANPERNRRDSRNGRIDGRTQEIQRLISRALRAAVHLEKLGERTIIVDCDVLDADGGTRTASICGGFVAMCMALEKLRKSGLVKSGVVRDVLAAISVGFVDNAALVDLCYQEDSKAQVDLNVVATANQGIVEIQGTAEGAPLGKPQFDELVSCALDAVPVLVDKQRQALNEADVDLGKLMTQIT